MAQDRVAIIGGGKVGSHLGARLKAAGADVRYGARNPDKPEDKALGAVPIQAAVDGANIVVLSVPAAVAVDVARGLALPAGTILVDCTNPLRIDNGPVWNPPPAGSEAAALAAALPDVKVVKGFNHFGSEIHENPEMAHGPADAYFAGDDVAAKGKVMALAKHAGFRPFDAGPLRNAALLENLCVLWIQLASTGQGRQFAFRIDKR